jgi:YegS/Rv2252/BmrU family lipid kinase
MKSPLTKSTLIQPGHRNLESMIPPLRLFADRCTLRSIFAFPAQAVRRGMKEGSMSQPILSTSDHTAPVPDASTPTPPIVILNPASKRGASLRRWLEKELKNKSAELVFTTQPRHAEQLALEAAQSGRDVVAVGGDGTVAEVAQGVILSRQPVRLGIVPCGNGNDYAWHTLGLPRDHRQALEIALRGAARPMDVGLVNGRSFLNSLGVGIDANIAATAERMKRTTFLRGHTLYYAASLTELLFHYHRCPELHVTIDGEDHDRRLYAMAAVNLGPTAGGGFKINPGADPCDGALDLCLIWKPSQLRALRLLPMVEKGKHLDQPEVRRLRVRAVTMEAAQPIFAHRDGEVLRADRFDVSVLPGALLVRQG